MDAICSGSGGASRGALIVFEGLDRCGKTTQAQKLAEYFQSTLQTDVRQIKFPDRSTTTGKIINDYLLNKAEMNDNAVHLLFAANRWEKREEMEALLRAGVSLIVDRYSFSGVAFSAAKGNPHLDRAWCAAPERGLLAPDAVFFLQVSATIANSREDYGNERYEKLDFQQVVRQEFAALRDAHFHEIDAARTIEVIHEEIAAIAATVVSNCRAGVPLQELWQRGPSQLVQQAAPGVLAGNAQSGEATKQRRTVVSDGQENACA